MSGGFDPLVPRPLDLPTEVPLEEDATGHAEALDEAKILAAPGTQANPPDQATLEQWRSQLHAWREDALARYGTPTRYDAPEAQWANRCFTVAQTWLWDELFFDFDAQAFTPERFLADAQQRFGGLDGVVLWHAYPIIGIDERNQWDFYDVPGLAEAAATLHEHGVAVFVDYNPWDTGTRRAGNTDAEDLATVVRHLNADGVFLDTLKKADPEFVAAMEAARPGIGLEGESKLVTERVADHALSWAQWFADSEIPGVLRARWFERRHMQHHIRRWNRDHAAELRSAWLNGVGVMVWEVVFGVWVGWNARDAAMLRRMLPVQRAMHRWLTEGEWTPLAVCEPPVFASTFELDGVTLYALVNTSSEDVTYTAGPGTWVTFDGPLQHGEAEVIVPAQGVAAMVHIADGAALPLGVADLELEPPVRDSSFPHRRAVRLAAPEWSGPTAGAELVSAWRSGAVPVPAGERVLTVRYRQRETGMYDGAPYVEEWKPLPPRLHDQRTLERAVTIADGVRVASREVSAAEYAQFLAAIGEASDAHVDAADADRPATGVTFARARQFAAWAGGRLPTEDEWQLAATRYGFERRTPAVWNWTESEHSDGRTRFVMLKGGADHKSEGSDWYVDGGVQSPEFALKFLLPGMGVDASPSIGFRVYWEN
ncbi:formylglycine-generating enzyme family protein [Ruania suaedae]|uniref:SUMF1/EgtB/PvdO family nonheme iron enzyme n=1 Tax=Ruania suaedae TaxID=2897774 RepID=UPI001E2C35F9|nr:SUMF1/EgtB/PvdO family nonheme iron enzyme [Ruania suaedae]UFU01882.1 formylglycine-generating enzyme family protein [Ruania suaedae]